MERNGARGTRFVPESAPGSALPARRDYKDTIFRRLFQDRENLLSLYEYYGSNVPLFRRNGYRQSGTMIP